MDWRKVDRTFPCTRCIGVISGADPFKDGHPYVNQVFIA